MSLVVDIRKNYGKFQLDVSFETGSGHVTGLLGASGCGKSVTLRCIAGIETPDEGRIVLDGRVLFDREKGINLSPQRRHVGYLFQNYALFPNMTVKQNITVGVRDRKAREQTAEQLIRAFGLEGNEHKYPRQLSGGQQQRTALARILASEPEVLLLDEPFSALDSYLKWQVEGELAELLEGFAGPVLFVTHSRDEVRRICHQACVLDQGRAQAVMPVDAAVVHPTGVYLYCTSDKVDARKAEKFFRDMFKAHRLDPHVHMIQSEKAFFHRLDSLKPAGEYEDDGSSDYASALLKQLSM